MDQVDAIIARVDVAGVQTPQGFRYDLILRAHRERPGAGLESSDDGSLVLALHEPVFTVAGERSERQGDVRGGYAPGGGDTEERVYRMMRSGIGYDVHAVVTDRPMMLGCVHFEDATVGLAAIPTRTS